MLKSGFKLKSSNATSLKSTNPHEILSCLINSHLFITLFLSNLQALKTLKKSRESNEKQGEDSLSFLTLNSSHFPFPPSLSSTSHTQIRPRSAPTQPQHHPRLRWAREWPCVAQKTTHWWCSSSTRGVQETLVCKVHSTS